MSLPIVQTPQVANRIVLQASSPDNNESVETLPAVDTASSPTPSIAASPPRRIVHSSPDHGHLASQATHPQQLGASQGLSFSLDDVFSTQVVVLRHCPKTARRELATLKDTVWNDVLRDPDNVEKWTIALAHTKLVLFIPPGKKSFKEKAAAVKQRIAAFLDGRLNDLWQQATRPTKRKHNSSTSNNVRRATLLAQEGQFGKAAKALISHGLDFDSQDAINNMRLKHPFSPPPPEQPPPSATPYSFTKEEIMDALLSFHSLSAGGPSGTRAAHIREAIGSDRGGSLLTTMTTVINNLAAGKVPSEVSPFLCGANLFAALKKSGGHRPVAVGETLRRWTAKCVTKKATADCEAYLSPNQLGVGVKCGAEAIIHAASSILHDDNIPQEKKWFLQIDFENAFNMIDRGAVISAVRRHCPKAAFWVETCYAAHTNLFFGNTRINSTTGAQQGDPLSSLLFALVLHPIILQVRDSLPDLILNAWYLDDGTLSGASSDLQAAFDIIRTQGASVGLNLNAGKSLVWCGNANVSNDPLQRGVPRAAIDGFHLLGAPVGNIPFSRDAVDARVAKIADIFDTLPSLNDSQIEYALLRSCFSFPKFSYCIRTCEPKSIFPIYEKFDDYQLATFSLSIGRQFDDAARKQVFLPIKLGGLGLRSAKQHAAAGFISSVSRTRSIVRALLPGNVTNRNIDDALSLLRISCGNATYSSLSLLPPEFTQHSLSQEIDSHSFKDLVDSANIRSKARLNSLSLPHAGDWLDAVPSPALNLNLNSRSFAAVVCYRLGLPVTSTQPCLASSCGHHQDEFGDHAMHCNSDQGMRGGRHDRLRDKIFKEAQLASLNPTSERPNLISTSLSRPADVFLPNWLDGRRMALDVSVTSPTQERLLLRAAETPGVAIEQRKSTKVRVHADACRREGIQFCPLVVETFGGWDGEAVDFLKKLARHSARRWGKNDAIQIKHFFQQLSVTLQRGNAALLVERDLNMAPS